MLIYQITVLFCSCCTAMLNVPSRPSHSTEYKVAAQRLLVLWLDLIERWNYFFNGGVHNNNLRPDTVHFYMKKHEGASRYIWNEVKGIGISDLTTIIMITITSQQSNSSYCRKRRTLTQSANLELRPTSVRRKTPSSPPPFLSFRLFLTLLWWCLLLLCNLPVLIIIITIIHPKSW